jgi:hypothetical protein
MGEIADMMLEGFMDEETGEIIDGHSPGYPRRMSDRKEDRQFKAERPTKDCPCVVPGCAKKFRPSTMYRDFLDHYRMKHGTKS